MSSDLKEEIINVTQGLLDAIANNDWAAYLTFVDEKLTCFEPEAKGQLVTGIPFHEYYFRLPKDATKPAHQTSNTIASPIVKMLSSDSAMIAYVRLTQRIDETGRPVTKSMEETRIWQRLGDNGSWKLVHFHRSAPS